MARKVVWAESAWRDLEQVADYIAEDSPAYAAAFVGRIRERAGTLDQLAYRGRIVPELGEPNLRELLIGNYRLLYEIHDDTIGILALIHGARDLAALWAREGRSERDDAF
jgi:plasmid stabilization system protein ParE